MQHPDPIAHGGNLAEARRRFPTAPAPLIDLSTGINPVPYPFTPPPPEAFTRLPEPAAVWALQQGAARAYGVADPAAVVAAPGTQILINLLPRLLPQPRVAVLGPTYAEHAAAWCDAGVAVDEVAEPEALGGAGAAILCNPNNPDGRRVPAAALLDLARRLRLLVVDEAFADADPTDSLASAVAGVPGLVVLRSFGKMHGLAGVRLGFALAAPAQARLLRQALGPWAVSGPALAIGQQALADRPWLEQSITRLRRDAARLDALLVAAGCRVVGGTPLFRLAETPDAPALAEHLGRHGIMVRCFADRTHLLRFGLPGPESWGRVQDALAIWIAS